jgi:hypothetical protein
MPHLRRDASSHSARASIPSRSLGDITGVLHVDLLLLRCLRGCQSCFFHRSINAHRMPSRFVRRRGSAAELGTPGPWSRCGVSMVAQVGDVGVESCKDFKKHALEEGVMRLKV